jgi:hypothetical protein
MRTRGSLIKEEQHNTGFFFSSQYKRVIMIPTVSVDCMEICGGLESFGVWAVCLQCTMVCCIDKVCLSHESFGEHRAYMLVRWRSSWLMPGT